MTRVSRNYDKSQHGKRLCSAARSGQDFELCFRSLSMKDFGSATPEAMIDFGAQL